MKASKKLVLSVVLVILLNMTMALPVSAAKPEKSGCGLLLIATSENDIQIYMAVCVEEENGNYIYSGNHPIQQQVGLYATVTNAQTYNNTYDIDEDIEYEEVEGVYRFALKEKLESGSEADVFPKMEAVKRNETVYFVHLDMNEDDMFVMEKTTVASVRNGVLVTKDKLENDSGNGDFSVIFNDSGNVVGVCKSGVATVFVQGSSDIYFISVIAAGTVVILAGVAAIIFNVTKKKKTAQIQYGNDVTHLDDDMTALDSDMVLNGFAAVSGNELVLKCHGGYLNGRIYQIPPEGITIGRDLSNSIRYPGQTPGISRHHIKLFWKNGQLMLLDQGSSNGTYLNQSGRIAQMFPVALKPGDMFYLGEKLNGFEISYK